MRLPRSLRVTRTADFDALLRRPDALTRAGRGLVSATLLPRPGAITRLGFTVGKRNAPRAVDRTLVKRVLRECCRAELAALLALSERGAGADLVLRLRRPLRGGLAGRTRTELRDALRRDARRCLSDIRERWPGIAARNASDAR